MAKTRSNFWYFEFFCQPTSQPCLHEQLDSLVFARRLHYLRHERYANSINPCNFQLVGPYM